MTSTDMPERLPAPNLERFKSEYPDWDLKAYSSGGDFGIASFIAVSKRNGRIYGHWNGQKYETQPAPRH